MLLLQAVAAHSPLWADMMPIIQAIKGKQGKVSGHGARLAALELPEAAPAPAVQPAAAVPALQVHRLPPCFSAESPAASAY